LNRSLGRAWLHLSGSTTCFTHCLWTSFTPEICWIGFDLGRTLSSKVEFANESAAEVDQHALFDAEQAELSFGQGTGDLPTPAVEGELAGVFQSQQFGSGGVLPWGGSGL